MQPDTRNGQDPEARQDAPSTAPLRIQQIAMLRGLGFSFRQIAKTLGTTPSAASMALHRHRRDRQFLQKCSELDGLSGRAINVLGRHGIQTRRDALAKSLLEKLCTERNCGPKTKSELREWLEKPVNSAL